MKKHVASEHEDYTNSGKLEFCLECNKNITKLAEHTKRVHLKIKQCICTLCDKEFFMQSDLDRHTREAHEKKRDICPECGLSFKKVGEHIKKVHRKEHSQETCPECGKTVGDVRDHMRSVHEKVKNFSCPICPLQTYKMNTLKRHLVIHEKYSALSKPMREHDHTKPVYNLENLDEATKLVVSGKMSRRKAAKVFKLSVHDLKKSCRTLSSR